jgi:Helix-turn-helix domain
MSISGNDVWFKMASASLEVGRLLGPAAFLVLGALCHRADRNGICWPSVSTICDDTRLSRSSVLRCLASLEKCGAIEVTRTKTDRALNMPNRYRLTGAILCEGGVTHDTTPSQTSSVTHDTTPSHPGSVTGDTGVVSPMTPRTRSIELDPTKPESKLRFSSEDLALARFMFEAIRKLYEKAKEPNFEKWANEVRLMREVDGRTLDEIRKLFTWANQDDFWRSNVLSPEKLRKQWDQLSIKAQGGHKNGFTKPSRHDPQGQIYNPKTPDLGRM